MSNALQCLSAAGQRLRSNRKFVAAYSFFGTAFAGGAKAAWDSGHLDWRLITWEHIAGAAVFLTLVNVYHLDTPAPGRQGAEQPQPATAEK
jgi:hypothetical protein